jgi:hypothetical protein
LFRFLFVFQAFILLINPKVLLHIQSNVGNITQKSLIILTGIALMATRPVHRGVVTLICAILAVTLISAIGTEYPGFSWRLYFGGAVSIVAPFILLTAQPDPKDRFLVLLVFAALPLLMTLLGVVYHLGGIAPLFASDPQSGTRLSGSQGAAFLAAACFTGTFAALELAERRHIGYGALLLVDVVILILAGGRMALAMAMLICGVGYLRSFQRVPLLKIFIPIWFIVCAGILSALFGEENLRHFTSTSLSHRDLIWAALQRHLNAHPWFGVGLGNQQLLVPASLTGITSTIASHNEYLRIAVELGYPGAILFFALAFAICFLVWNSAWVRRDPMFIVCAIAFFIYGLTDNTFSAPAEYFILTAASFACQGRSAMHREVEDSRRHLHEAPTHITGTQRSPNLGGPS